MGTEADYIPPPPKPWADRHPIVTGLGALAGLAVIGYVGYYALMIGFATIGALFVAVLKLIAAII